MEKLRKIVLQFPMKVCKELVFSLKNNQNHLCAYNNRYLKVQKLKTENF